MKIGNLPILNGKIVAEKDVRDIIEVLANCYEQGDVFQSSDRRSVNVEYCVYLFIKPNKIVDENAEMVKGLLEKYGVKSDVHVSRYHGTRKVVRLFIENTEQENEYEQFGTDISNLVRDLAEEREIAAKRAMRQEKLFKVFPFLKKLQKSK
ncbi:MAG: hypothetical protein J6Y49_01960 [Alphaproteobacteria bacterium]|nr:hypothetical protein [Alphaproteobacteria bacterium]